MPLSLKVLISAEPIGSWSRPGYTSAARWQAYRSAKSIATLAAYEFDSAVLQDDEGSRSLFAVRGSADLFPMLGVTPPRSWAFAV